MHVFVATLLLCAGLESDPQFRAAQKNMEAFELEKAATTFDEVARRPGLPAEDRALALVWLGIAYAELRDEARAALAFEDAVTADPLIVLPKDSSPKIKSLLEDARARVRLRSRATPVPTPTPTPAPTPAPTAAPEAAPAAAPDDDGGSFLFRAGLATAIVGGAVAVGGGIGWGVGLALRQQAEDAKFQDDAAVLNERSSAAQIAGQVGLAVGVLILVGGGVMLGLSFGE